MKKFSNVEIQIHPDFAALAEMRAESLWLANFSSHNTRAAYQRAVGSFIVTLGITTPDDR